MKYWIFQVKQYWLNQWSRHKFFGGWGECSSTFLLRNFYLYNTFVYLTQKHHSFWDIAVLVLGCKCPFAPPLVTLLTGLKVENPFESHNQNCDVILRRPFKHETSFFKLWWPFFVRPKSVSFFFVKFNKTLWKSNFHFVRFFKRFFRIPAVLPWESNWVVVRS